MEIKFDLLKQLRDTIVWISANLSKIKNAQDKAKIDKLVKVITDMIIHKKAYLERIKRAILAKQDVEKELEDALNKARTDTETLIDALKSTGLESKDLGIDLNINLQSLAQQKMLAIEGFDPNKDEATIIKTFAGYESQWQDIAHQLESVKTKLNA
jgi:hypothetical protein